MFEDQSSYPATTCSLPTMLQVEELAGALHFKEHAPFDARSARSGRSKLALMAESENVYDMPLLIDSTQTGIRLKKAMLEDNLMQFMSDSVSNSQEDKGTLFAMSSSTEDEEDLLTMSTHVEDEDGLLALSSYAEDDDCLLTDDNLLSSASFDLECWYASDEPLALSETSTRTRRSETTTSECVENVSLDSACVSRRPYDFFGKLSASSFVSGEIPSPGTTPVSPLPPVSFGFKKRRERFVWVPKLHQRFEDAINTLGVEQAKPHAILQLMSFDSEPGESLPTLLNIKSHLQKFRGKCRIGLEGCASEVDGEKSEVSVEAL